MCDIKGKCKDCKRVAYLRQIHRPVTKLIGRNLRIELVSLCEACLKSTRIYFSKDGYVMKMNMIVDGEYTIIDDSF